MMLTRRAQPRAQGRIALTLSCLMCATAGAGLLSSCGTKSPARASSGGHIVPGGANGSGENMRLDNRAIDRSYKVFGKSYTIFRSAAGFEQSGVASWYGPGFHGRTTANGEKYDMRRMTAAHKNLPFGTKLRVENLENGRTIEVRVNDRGPFHGQRIIDLSRRAADKIGMLKNGTARVRLSLVGARVPAPASPAQDLNAQNIPGDIADEWDTKTAGRAGVSAQPPSQTEPLDRQQAVQMFSETENHANGKAKSHEVWIQIGSYSEPRHADIVSEELSILGLAEREGSSLVKLNAADDGHHKLRLGPFKPDAGRQFLEEIRQAGYYDAFIVRE